MKTIINFLWLIPFYFMVQACEYTPPKEKRIYTPQEDSDDMVAYLDTSLTEAVLYDKILGMLVGSAVGDAMGAPTEMWGRKDIEIEYGFVDSLDKVMRIASPEGPWDYNLPAGGTTDDTRWKKLTIEYLINQDQDRYYQSPPQLNANEFAQHIIDEYLANMALLKTTDSFDPEPFEKHARQMTWLQEWALVAKPYVEDDLDGYALAVNRFYGGDLACAGMLYTPAIGAFYPGKPAMAYQEAYKLGIFDLGYARDISSLTAAMVAAALAAKPHPDSVVNVIRDIDPNRYFASRLIGRSAYRIYKSAYRMAYHAKGAQLKDLKDPTLHFPVTYSYDTLQFIRTQKAYELMDEHLQDVPFHAGEVFMINLTALLFCDFDFQKTIEFIINYGRDNDTVGAVSGAIAGAYWGVNQIPEHLKNRVIQTSKREMDIDLEKLAQEFTQQIIKRKKAL